MEPPELLSILNRLVVKYRDVSYAEWKKLYDEGERVNDCSEDEPNPVFFWQAHTDILELEKNENGKYAHISISIYPGGVHSSPPAPKAGMFVYESGWCDIGTPEKCYTYDQRTRHENMQPN